MYIRAKDTDIGLLHFAGSSIRTLTFVRSFSGTEGWPELLIANLYPFPLRRKGNIMSYSPVETGKRIRILRESQGLSRAKFSESLNISLSHLQKIEIGANGPSIDLLVDIADLYGASIDYLLIGEERNKSIHVKSALEDVSSRLLSIIESL